MSKRSVPAADRIAFVQQAVAQLPAQPILPQPAAKLGAADKVRQPAIELSEAISPVVPPRFDRNLYFKLFQ